jgi:hypothetical protein
MPWPSYECYGGPLDGAQQTVQYEGQHQFVVPFVSGRYVLASAVSDARGRDMGPHWVWREAQP